MAVTTDWHQYFLCAFPITNNSDIQDSCEILVHDFTYPQSTAVKSHDGLSAAVVRAQVICEIIDFNLFKRQHNSGSFSLAWSFSKRSIFSGPHLPAGNIYKKCESLK
jgi:hypothetical protein